MGKLELVHKSKSASQTIIVAYQWLIRAERTFPPFVTEDVYSEESIRDRYGNRVIRPIKETKIPIPVRD